ncbi:DUF5367 family protein [Hyunsoonleella ulvae]|uniref:DUF5367 family protein n=1 Tax=Hyunsoonleella ulvae TaxID=2799948 RepID=UPI00193AB9E1|nr:DUF5367 family protein [Hyunsoonleella ulvae]
MKLLRAITIGTIIWGFGVSLFNLSFYIPILEDAQQQANMVLFLMVMPLVWYGARFYYRKDKHTHGYWVGQAFFLTAMVLDAVITVLVFIIPNGGSYYEFFTDLGFWIIGVEFITITVLYWYTKIYVRTLKAIN